MTLTGHDDHVARLTFSGDGRHLASVSCSEPLPFSHISHNYSIRVWDTRIGEETMAPMRSSRGIMLHAIAFALGDTGVAVCTSEGIVRVRDIFTGRDVRCWQCVEPMSKIECAVFSPDGALVATGLCAGTVRVWITDTGEHIFTLQGPQSPITGIAFSSNGRLAAAFSGPVTIHMWDIRTGLTIGCPLEINDLIGPTQIKSLAISPDGTVLAVGSFTHRIDYYDLDAPVQTFNMQEGDCFNSSLALSPDGLHLAVARHDNICLWDRRTQQQAATSLHGHSGIIHSISYSPDGMYIASASNDHTIRIWDVGGNGTAPQPLPRLRQTYYLPLSSHTAIIVSDSDNGSVQVWRRQGGRLKLKSLLRRNDRVLCVAISPNGQLIASASYRERLSQALNSGLPPHPVFRLWNTQTGEPVGDMFEGVSDAIRALEFSPDMSQLVSVSEELVSMVLEEVGALSRMAQVRATTSATLHVWNLKTRMSTTLGTVKYKQDQYYKRSYISISFSPDGQHLAAAVSGVERVHIWQMRSGWPFGEPLETGEHPVSFVAFSHDGANIVTGTVDGTFKVRDIQSGQIVSVHNLPMRTSADRSFQSRFNWLARSPNERFTAGESDGTNDPGQKMRLWDAAMPGVVTIVHLNRVEAGAAFSADSQSLMIGGKDRIVVWQVEAVLALAAGPQCDPLAQLLREGVGNDGWVKGPSGELLLWIPPEYREYLQLPPCTLMISKYRVVLSGDAAGLRYGTDWTSCWR